MCAVFVKETVFLKGSSSSQWLHSMKTPKEKKRKLTGNGGFFLYDDRMLQQKNQLNNLT